MSLSLDPASVFEKFPKNHTKKLTSPMIFCIGPQILNETDIFNGTCGSFLCLGCFSELGFSRSISLLRQCDVFWLFRCCFPFFVPGSISWILNASQSFFLRKNKVGHFKKTASFPVSNPRNLSGCFPQQPCVIPRSLDSCTYQAGHLKVCICQTSILRSKPMPQCGSMLPFFFGWGLGFIPVLLFFGAFLVERI